MYQYFRCSSVGKESACCSGTQVQFLGWENSQEKEMATHSSILAWRIPWTEEPSRLQFMELQHEESDTNEQLAHKCNYEIEEITV